MPSDLFLKCPPQISCKALLTGHELFECTFRGKSCSIFIFLTQSQIDRGAKKPPNGTLIIQVGVLE